MTALARHCMRKTRARFTFGRSCMLAMNATACVLLGIVEAEASCWLQGSPPAFSGNDPRIGRYTGEFTTPLRNGSIVRNPAAIDVLEIKGEMARFIWHNCAALKAFVYHDSRYDVTRRINGDRISYLGNGTVPVTIIFEAGRLRVTAGPATATFDKEGASARTETHRFSPDEGRSN